MIANSAELERWIAAELASRPRQRVLRLFLDRKSGMIREAVLGEGTLDHVPLYPREVARRALEPDAAAVILVHNQPAGDPAPSPQDVESTRKVADALAAIGVALHDHVIVSRLRVLSMRREGLL